MLSSEQLSHTAVTNQITTADRHLLLRRQEGRLSYTSGRGRPTVVVTYTISDDHLVIRVPEYNEIGWYAPGAEVGFTVDGDQTHPGAVELRRIATTGGCHLHIADRDPKAEHWPKGINLTVICLPLATRGFSGRRFDLLEFGRAIDASDAETQIAAYADSAEVEVIDPDNPPSSPRVLKGKSAIADWVRSNCQRSVRQRVVRIIDGDDRIAYTVSQVQRDGSHQIATSTSELQDGLVTQQHTIMIRDSGGWHSRLSRPNGSETQRVLAG